MTLVYGNLIASSIDPIEKKPFFHFLPGSLAYSIATVGCNFRCLHCQNSDISQMSKGRGSIPNNFVPPKEVVDAAKDSGCQSIAYTYTEPTIFFEYAHDVARLALKAGLKNVSFENILTESAPLRNENGEPVYLLPNQFIKGYINHLTGEITKNPDYDPAYTSSAFEKNLLTIK